MTEPVAHKRVLVRHTQPLYPRLLRLDHVHPNAWQRAVLGEGMAVVGILLALADLASAWAIVVLPVAVAGVVKAHDVVTGLLPPRSVPPPVLSADLQALVQQASDRAGHVPAPFAVVQTADGAQLVTPPAEVADVLTADELAAALREGLAAAGPQRAVLVPAGAGVEAYEDGAVHLLPPVTPVAVPAPPAQDAPVRTAEPDQVAVRVRTPEPETSVRIVPPPSEPEPEVEIEIEVEVDGIGSDALWSLLWEARGRAAAGAAVPFALLEDETGVVEVRAPERAASLLTADEQAAALRAGLVQRAQQPDAPSRAVLVYSEGAQLVGYEPGLASGIVVAAGDLALVPVDVPNVFPSSKKAPTP